MAAEDHREVGRTSKLVIKNIGLLLSGDLNRPNSGGRHHCRHQRSHFSDRAVPAIFDIGGATATTINANGVALAPA